MRQFIFVRSILLLFFLILRSVSSDLSVDAMDVSGEQQVDVNHDIKKIRLHSNGSAIAMEKVEKLGNDTKLDPNRYD